MRRLLVFFIVFIGFVSMLLAQDVAEPSALTVRLFSTYPIQEITFIPLGSNDEIRFCPQCPQKKIGDSTTWKKIDSELHMTGDPHAYKQVQFQGAFRVRVEGSPQVETAAGQWVIGTTDTGIRTWLTISTERYVMAVLNGEASPDEPFESLKAMAIVARTFALLNAHRHAAEGFDLCDSTHCQALRFGSVRSEIEQAVLATTGETLWYRAHRAETYATQHCGGEAEDATSVWPNLHAPYLHSHPDPYCLRRSIAKWHADIGIAQVARILHEQRWNIPEQIEIIRIIKRTSTGRAQMLDVSGQGKHAEISASSLHFAIDRALGWNQLRSDWYEITLNNGIMHFEGKGYGHGVGLCQTGSFEMAVKGRNYREILNFYFPGTQVRITPSDTGWKEIPGVGWTLAAVNPPQSVLQTGNIEWAKAQSIFPPKTAIHPFLRLMPSTELFRQATNEPGWTLASTRETNIVLQPLSIVRTHGDESLTLLHEFLHVLVEQEAAPQVPLWLREGLVEVLSDDHQHLSASMPISAIESALKHPDSATESQRAHAASAQLAQQLINKYGIQTVCSWLRSGVPSTALAP